MKFSAVILAGGKSSRMGRDKAFLVTDGVPLLTRQIHLVRAIGADEVFISGQSERNYSQFGGCVLRDEFPAAGPLAGIAEALRVAATPMLLVLAVDMADVRVELLQRLRSQCQAGQGVVPVAGQMIEALAAFYPQAAGPLARELLTRDSSSPTPGARTFAEHCVSKGLVRLVAVPPGEVPAFKSWNTPADIPGPR